MALTYNDETMNDVFRPMLFPGEESLCPVYCVHKKTGFFARPQDIRGGFATITSEGRLLAAQVFIKSCHRTSYVMQNIKQVKNKKNIFGQYEVEVTFDIQGNKEKIKFQMAKNIFGNNLPNQYHNVEKMLYILDKYVVK